MVLEVRKGQPNSALPFYLKMTLVNLQQQRKRDLPPWVQIPVISSQSDLRDGHKKTVLNAKGPLTLVLLM